MRTHRQPVRALDKLDRKILALLQQDGRMAMTDLADTVGLTITPCIERVKRMERDGVITGYHARVSPAALDASLLVFVEITVSAKSGRTFDDFRREVVRIPQVLECHLGDKYTKRNFTHARRYGSCLTPFSAHIVCN